MKQAFIAKVFLITVLLISSCAPATETTELIPIQVQLGTTHQAVYGGFYAADQNGYYAQQGLAVSLIEGGPNIDAIIPLLNTSVQFSVIGASALISARASGKPVRALATILRRDPVVFFSLADSGIVRLQDFVGKKVLAPPTLQARLFAMLSKAEINPEAIHLVSAGSAADLYTGKIDIASGLITSSVLSVQQAGYPVNIIYPDNYGVHFYSTTIIAADDYITSSSEVITRFLQATIQGWNYAVENPQTVGKLVAQYNPKANVEFESASMVAMIPYINTGEDHIGWMKPDVWAGMVKTMQQEGEAKTNSSIDNSIYTLEFIQKIYGETNS